MDKINSKLKVDERVWALDLSGQNKEVQKELGRPINSSKCIKSHRLYYQTRQKDKEESGTQE